MADKDRSKYFCTEFYPESCSQTLVEDLKGLGVAFFLSPLHDKDISDTGEFKKAHYHCLLMFESLKSIQQVEKLVKPFGAVGLFICNSQRGYARYLCHLDDPDKAQYDPAEVLAYQADYSDFLPDKDYKYNVLAKVMDLCLETHCYSFSKLLIFVRQSDFSMFRAICDNSLFVREFLKSLAWDEQHERARLSENDTGELSEN